MGIYHQGGVIPMQIHLGKQAKLGNTDVLWWKTYSPPVWLLGGKSDTHDGVQTVDLMGMPIEQLKAVIEGKAGSCEPDRRREVIVVAPRSRTDLDGWMTGSESDLEWLELWTEWRHLNLDDLDWGKHGVVGMVKKAVRRRGLTAWRVRKECKESI